MSEGRQRGRWNDDGRSGTQRRHALPIVTVQQSPRDLELKRRLVAGITEAFVDAYGIGPESVQVFIHEVDHDNGAKAGILASDR
jgi:4-oxalocrotonate tautomerase